MNIANKLEILTASIKKAREASPIAAASVTLLAASKTQPVAVIEEAIAAGITCFGENRVQEAQEKWQDIKKRYPHVRLHLIGQLQTNKVKQALALFDVIQTLDRAALAEAIVGVRDSGFGIQEKKFYIQVNTGKELQKAGVFPEDADEFIAFCRKLELPVAGLMCVPPVNQPPAPHFALLREIAIRNNLSELSMGMSDDFEVAVRMSSTCVRLGTALFGKRI
jgi:pyridoxal phosphate enzyme (YggS family)